MEKTLIFLNKISKTSKTCNVTVFIPNTEKNTVTYMYYTVHIYSTSNSSSLDLLLFLNLTVRSASLEGTYFVCLEAEHTSF